ncbi:putative cytochrome p450 [Diaporthe ampelina]|uniref:Putative cytochrome p450 n=1 Tax=Diaporthe ampelina TaxID=1214573 RepID=A0A0G2FDZ0_9PEZI|nr:putative cytochrome p450 [Diaporthe ampelina]
MRRPIVRISPFELHVDDSSFFNEIYRQDGRWHKYEFSTKGQAAPGGAVFTADHDAHKRRRMAINPFLSKPAIMKRMDLIQSKINLLQERIKEATNQGTMFELGLAFSAMTIDIATAYVMGKSYDSLRSPGFNKELTRVLQEGGYLWHVNKHIQLSNFLFKHLLPFMPSGAVPEAVRPFFVFLRDCEDRTKELIDLHDRQGVTNTGEEKPSARGFPSSQTLVELIMSSSLPREEKQYKRINDEVGTVTGAGFETSSNTLRHISYHLYSNPHILARLRAELDAHPEACTEAAAPEDAEGTASHNHRTWSWDKLSRLPYLTGVVKEGLRLTPGIVTRMQRVAEHPLTYREGGAGANGRAWTLPAGTPVGMSLMSMHMDEDVFPQPLRFWPERWADEEDEGRRKRLDKHFAPFSRGTRICVGMHLAWAELYLTVAMLASQFDFEFTGGTGPEDVEWLNDRFILGVKGKNGIRVVASKRQA